MCPGSGPDPMTSKEKEGRVCYLQQAWKYRSSEKGIWVQESLDLTEGILPHSYSQCKCNKLKNSTGGSKSKKGGEDMRHRFIGGMV